MKNPNVSMHNRFTVFWKDTEIQYVKHLICEVQYRLADGTHKTMLSPKNPGTWCKKTLDLSGKNHRTICWGEQVTLTKKKWHRQTKVQSQPGKLQSIFDANADKFMRDKFLSGVNESFSRFREGLFYRDGQRKPEEPPISSAFAVSQAISFEAPYHTNKLPPNTII